MSLTAVLNQKNSEILEEILRLMGLLFEANQMIMPTFPEDEEDKTDRDLEELCENLAAFIFNTNDNKLTLKEFSRAAPVFRAMKILELKQEFPESGTFYYQHPDQPNLMLELQISTSLTDDGLICVKDTITGEELYYTKDV